MLANQVTLTHNTNAISVEKTKEGNHASSFYGEDDVNNLKFNMTVSHSIPSDPGGSGESHFIRLDIDEMDANGVYVRRNSVWLVMKTIDSPQVTASLTAAAECLRTFLNNTQLENLARRES